MKKRIDLRRLCIWLGIGLFFAAALLLFGWQWRIHSAQKTAAAHVSAIRSRISTPQSAMPEARLDNAMPVLSIDGTDFAGILEMPRFGSALPVCADWGSLTQQPCRLSGSVYDRTLRIGATTQQGQYDFYREISAGDSLFFTDMEGNRYAYQVTDIRYAAHADQAALEQQDAALTLFIKNIYAFEYILVFCQPAN